MLGGLALKWKWRERQAKLGNPPTSEHRDRAGPSLLAQVCALLRRGNSRDSARTRSPRTHARTSAGHVDKTRSASCRRSASRSPSSTNRSRRSPPALDKLQAETGLDIPIHVDGASGGFIARSCIRARLGLPHSARPFDQRLGTQVRLGASGRRLDRLARESRPARRLDLPRQLSRRRHAHVRAEFFAAGRPDRLPVLPSAPPGTEGYRAVHEICYDVAEHIAKQLPKIGRSNCSSTATATTAFPPCRGLAARRERALLALRSLRSFTLRAAASRGVTMVPNIQDMAVMRILVRHGSAATWPTHCSTICAAAWNTSTRTRSHHKMTADEGVAYTH